MDKEFKAKILNEINKSGFPTELEISNLLQSNGWEVDFNNYYLDLDENKGREIDLIADYYVQDNQQQYSEFHYQFIIEVKKELSKPWIIITSKSSKFERSLGLPNYFSFNKSLPKKTISKAFYEHNQIIKDKIGRSGFEGFNKGKDKLFTALCNSLKALKYFQQQSSFADDLSEDRMFSYFEPLIILDGILIEATLNKDFEIQVKETDYIQFKFDYLSPNYRKSNAGHIIHIVRKNFLTDFLKNRREQFNKITNYILST